MARESGRAGLVRLRRAIDGIDRQLVQLLHHRLELAREIGDIKRDSSTRHYVPWREKAVLERVLRYNKDLFPPDVLTLIYREILSVGRAAQSPITVGFPGTEGSLAHLAAREQFGASTRLRAVPDLSSVLEAVASGGATYGIVPLEVSVEGIGSRSLELFLDSDLFITAEYFIRVPLVLASCSRRRKIRRVLGQEILLADSRAWIARHVPGAQLVVRPTVGDAAREAQEDPAAATVCPPFTARHFDLHIRKEGVSGHKERQVRYLTAGKTMPAATRADKTTIAFTVVDRVGILRETLQAFTRRRINISFLESYFPSRTLPTTTFFADFMGHASDRQIQSVLSELRKHCSFVKVLGSYPVFESRTAATPTCS